MWCNWEVLTQCPRTLAGAASPEDVTGTGRLLPEGSSHGCGQKAAIPYCVGLSVGLLACPHDMAAGFLQ